MWRTVASDQPTATSSNQRSSNSPTVVAEPATDRSLTVEVKVASSRSASPPIPDDSAGSIEAAARAGVGADLDA